MKTELESLLHLYLGCKCKGEGSMIYTLTGITKDCHSKNRYFLTDNTGNSCVNVVFKPILRSLDSLIDEEIEEIWYMHEPKNVFTMNSTNGVTRKVALCSERTKYLLSKWFDLFDLINKDLALDERIIDKP